MKISILEYKNIGSKSEAVEDITRETLKVKIRKYFTKPAFVAAYLDYGLLFGRWQNDDFKFSDDQTIEEKYIQKIRIFSPDKEFYAWRTQHGLRGRIRKDDFNGSGTDVAVAQQVLVGTKIKSVKNDFTEICEQRGSRLNLPLTNILVDENRNRLFIKTHNYIEYYPTCQATYSDCRFVMFTDGKTEMT